MPEAIDVTVPEAHRLIDFGVINHVLLVLGGRPGKHEQIVSLCVSNFSRCPRVDLFHGNVVHGYDRVVLLAPFFGIDIGEPLVVFRDEMSPLRNLQALLPSTIAESKERPESGSRSCQPEEISPGRLFAFLFD